MAASCVSVAEAAQLRALLRECCGDRAQRVTVCAGEEEELHASADEPPAWERVRSPWAW